MEKPFGRSHKRVAMTALFFSQNTVFCKKRSVDPEQIPKWKSYFGHKKPYKFEVLFKNDGIEDNFEDFENLLNYYSNHLKIKPIGRRYTSTYETTSFQNITQWGRLWPFFIGNGIDQYFLVVILQLRKQRKWFIFTRGENFVENLTVGVNI